MRNIIKVGDVIMCISNGGNNTHISNNHKLVYEGDGPFTVKAVHSGNEFNAQTLNCNTLETECGAFLWNHTKFFKVIKYQEPNYEIY